MSARFVLLQVEIDGFVWPWKHVHRHECVAVKHLTRSEGSAPVGLFGRYADPGPYSVVVRKCRCGDQVSGEIPGHFSIDELNGREVDSKSAVASLIGGKP